MKSIKLGLAITALCASAAANAGAVCNGVTADGVSGSINCGPSLVGHVGKSRGATTVVATKPTNAIPQVDPPMPAWDIPPQPPAPTYANSNAVFVPWMNYNFAVNPQVNAMFSNLQDINLARLTRQYYVLSNGNATVLTNEMAMRLNATNLKRYAAAMGYAIVDQAVQTFSPAAVKAAYFAGARYPVIPRSEASYAALGYGAVVYSYNPKYGLASATHAAAAKLGPDGLATPVEQLDMTLYEIYLDYMTVGTTTSAAAAAMTLTVATAALSGAATFGYGVGTAIYWIDDAIDPDINIWIGDEVGADVQTINDISDPQNPVAYVDIPGFYEYVVGSSDWCEANEAGC